MAPTLNLERADTPWACPCSIQGCFMSLRTVMRRFGSTCSSSSSTLIESRDNQRGTSYFPVYQTKGVKYSFKASHVACPSNPAAPVIP